MKRISFAVFQAHIATAAYSDTAKQSTITSKAVVSLVFAPILIFGCASQLSTMDVQYQHIEKTILLNSVEEIKNRCESNAVRSRHVECFFIEDGKNNIPYPTWVLLIEQLRKESQKIGSLPQQAQYRNLAYGNAFVSDRVAPLQAQYKNLAYEHVFIPEDGAVPFSDSFTRNLKYVLFDIKTHNVDGIPTYSIAPRTIQESNLMPVADYSFEAWNIINSVFPVASIGSPEAAKYIETQKIARAEAERQRKEQEARKALEEYRSQFENAKTKEQVTNFIEKYETNDPDNLIGKAREQLVRLEKEEIAQKKKDELLAVEKEIIWCNNMVKRAQEAINQQQVIGAISGYVNKAIMYEAGTYIESCTRRFPEMYSRYRELGGTKEF